jgi:dolichol-phosphate mannosyltransferase
MLEHMAEPPVEAPGRSALRDARTETTPATAVRTVCVIPALDEEGKIGRLVKRFGENDVTQIVVVDDGSTDATADEARAAGAEVLSHPVNRGVGAAIRTGIDYAVEQGFDVVTVMGGDDQDHPSDLPQLVAPIAAGNADFVQGSRRLDGRRTVDMPFFRRLTTKLYSFAFRLATGFASTDATNGFRAFRTEIVRDHRINLHQDWLDTYELEPYLFYKAIRCGYRVREAQVTKTYHRELGYTKMRPGRDWWRIARPIVFLKFGLRR